MFIIMDETMLAEDGACKSFKEVTSTLVWPVTVGLAWPGLM